MAELLLTAAAAASAAAPTLSTIGTIASVGGALVSGLGAMQQGKAAKVNANFQAKQMEQQAGQDRAYAQRVAIEKRREANVAISNAQARGAASGGGATDPTVLNITGALAQQGEYNALSALFSGEERARGQELQASATRMEGKQAKKAGMIGGVSTIASGIGNTLMAKYAPASAASDAVPLGTAGGMPWQQPGMVRPAYMGGGGYY